MTPNGLEMSRPASQGKYRAKAKHPAGRVGREAPWKGSIELLASRLRAGSGTRRVSSPRFDRW
jgi:hypothetical protein